jgi:VCBS repeat-containing protein
VAGYAAHRQEVGARTITYDDGLSTQNALISNLDGFGPVYNTVTAPRMGDTITNLEGVLSYQWAGNAASGATWRVRSAVDGTNTFVEGNPRPVAPAPVGGDLKVVSFNVLNYFTTVDLPGATTANGLDPRGADSEGELIRQTEKLVTAILAMDADILGLVELENNFLPGNPGNAIEFLVDQLNAIAGPGTYDWVNPGTQFVGDDAISVGVIYRPSAVSIANGTTVEILSDSDLPGLGLGGLPPVFDGPNTNRAPLAVTFEENGTGASLTVVVNHLKSKGSPGTAGAADDDQNDGAGFANQTRLNGATALNAWLNTDPTGSGDSDFLLLGDFNAYAQEDPITFLESQGYVDLAERFLGDEAYSFVFDGQIGTLDYAFANASLTAQVTGTTEWHVNADEADALDYNLDFGRDPAIFDRTVPYRNSDHDPVMVGLNLVVPNQPPVAEDDIATLDLDQGEATTINVLANDSDPDDDPLQVVGVVDASPESGIVMQNADGTFTYDANGFFAYLAAGEKAIDSFSYILSDGNLEDSATVTVTIDGPADITNSGTPFRFSQGTNGGANTFGFDGDSFFISGQGIRGRAWFQDFDDFLVEAARVFDGMVERTGTINDQRLPLGQGPNILNVNANNEVTIGGRSTQGKLSNSVREHP